MRSDPPNQYRLTKPGDRFSTTPADGMNGIFVVPLHKHMSCGHVVNALCVVSSGLYEDGKAIIPWEHVSVRIMEYHKDRIPTWNEMCAIKEMFWNDDEVVVQYHPAKKDYVNCHPCVLHLWRPILDHLPTPPKICV